MKAKELDAKVIYGEGHEMDDQGECMFPKVVQYLHKLTIFLSTPKSADSFTMKSFIFITNICWSAFETGQHEQYTTINDSRQARDIT